MHNFVTKFTEINELGKITRGKPLMAGPTKSQRLLAKAVQQHKAGRLNDAEKLYQRVLQADPACADACYLLGMLADEVGQPANALQHIAAALKIAPGNGQFHYSRGVILQNTDRPDDAAAAYRKTLQYNPEHIQALENLAVALVDLGDDVQGEAVCRQVLKLAPHSVIAHQNLGTLLVGRGRRKTALEHFDQVISLDPANAAARSKRYQMLLSLGRFQEGYRDFAWRQHSADFSVPSPPRLLPLASLGERRIDGRNLVILPEQGVGDEVLFASGLPAVLAKACRVLLFADPRLIPLFRRSFPDLDVRATMPANRSHWPEGIDATWLRCEAGDLPQMAFGDAYPVPATYLRADPDRVEYWRERLRDLPGRHIGIAWRGGADARARQARSITLQDLTPLIDSLDASFVNLQYAGPDHDPAAEIHRFNAARGRPARLIELDGLDTRNDLDELAALTLALDFVVTIDSAIAHLAAAVGARTCVLLPPGGDWRWFDGIDHSPWYAHARVWRRAADEGWTAPVQAMLEWLSVAENTAVTSAEWVDNGPAVVRSTSNEDKQGATAENTGTALLLNDTSAWYHWGCSCTSIALHEGLRATHASVNSCALLQDLPAELLPKSTDALESASVFKRFRAAYPWLIEAMENADRIVINGEGTLHGNGPQAIGLLYLAWIAADRIGRPVSIVNHSVYPLDGNAAAADITVSMYHKVYERLERAVVREPASYAVLDAMGIPATLGFDCLPLFAQQHGPDLADDRELDPHIVIAGSVLLTPARIALYADLVDRFHKDGYKISLLLGARGFPATDDAKFAAALYSAAAGKFDVVLTTSEFDWLRRIQQASLLISGRFHHSIAAACMRTPFVALASNTPKTTGLLAVLAELAPNPAGFSIVEEQQGTMRMAVNERLAAPAGFVLDNAALQHIADLAMENFRRH